MSHTQFRYYGLILAFLTLAWMSLEDNSAAAPALLAGLWSAGYALHW